MPPRRRRRENTPPLEYDQEKFCSPAAAKLFEKIGRRSLVPERGVEIEEEVCEDLRYEVVRSEIIRRGWRKLADADRVGEVNSSIVYEYYANFPSSNEDQAVFVRGQWVPSGEHDINALFDVPDYTIEEDEYFRLASSAEFEHTRVAETLGVLGTRFSTLSGVPKYLKRNQLNPAAKAWLYFVSARLLPSTHFTEIDVDRLKLVYAILTGLRINIGRIIRSSIRHSCRMTTTAGLGHGTFITELCHTYGVPTFDTDVRSGQKRPITKLMILTYRFPEIEQQSPNRQHIEEDMDFDIDVDELTGVGGPAHAAPQGDHAGPSTSHAAGPSSSYPTGIEGRLDAIYRQNEQILAQNAYLINERNRTSAFYNDYLQERQRFDRNHIDELNKLVHEWTMSEDRRQHFSYPPDFTPYQPQPPPQ